MLAIAIDAERAAAGATAHDLDQPLVRVDGGDGVVQGDARGSPAAISRAYTSGRRGSLS